MLPSEQKVATKYELLGYRVLHRGAPDFLLLKKGELAEGSYHPDADPQWKAGARTVLEPLLTAED